MMARAKNPAKSNPVTRPVPAAAVDQQMADASRGKAADGRFAYEGLERVIHEKARLGILTSLAAYPKGLPFGDLKELCSLTDGNLNRHLAVLEEERLVATSKSTRGRRPQTMVVMTPTGRSRFQQYINVLERVVADAAETQKRVAADARSRKLAGGWSPA
jgi:DNA-binding MarR family transcriptional regulator